ncbi:MAG: DUF58 domain-containing protein [bacterium]
MIRFHLKGMLLYCAATAGSLVFSSFYGGPAPFAWLYAMLLLIPLSALYIYVNFLFLRIYQEIEVHRPVRGEDHRYRAKIENAGILPIHAMRLRLCSDRCSLYDIEEGQKLSLRAGESRELVSGISCRYAGSYNIGIHSVSFTDPFALFTVTLPVPYTFRAVVSPPVTDLADRVLDLENRINSSGRRSSRLSEETPGSGMRVYQRGDPMSAINWKVTARLGTPVTRLPDKMEKRTVTILMQAAYAPDREQDLDFLKKRDYFLEFAVSAVWHFAGQGIPVRMIFPAGKVTRSAADSYETFMEFYSIAADGIFYYSGQDYEQFLSLISDPRSRTNEDGSWILIREDPGPGQDPVTVIE